MQSDSKCSYSRYKRRIFTLRTCLFLALDSESLYKGEMHGKTLRRNKYGHIMKEVVIWKRSLRQVNYTYKSKILGFPLRNVYIEIDCIFFCDTVKTLSKPKTCLNQTDFTVTSTKCLCNLNLRKSSTCLNWKKFSVPKGFGFRQVLCTNYISYAYHYLSVELW